MVFVAVMIFKRSIYKKLKEWQERPGRKPLLLMGARQIGKTTVLKSFAQNEYSDYVYLNLERQQDINGFFTGNKDPGKILENISLLHGSEIKENSTIIILDEIQECKDAIISLKYFAEEKPDIHIIGAGSLLGLSIGNDRSFPVGKVDFLDMYPLSFEEYLEAANSKLYMSYHHFLDQAIPAPIPETFHNALTELHKEYLLFGGMPEVASTYISERNVQEAQKIQDQILQAYTLDFVKHAESSTATKIQQIWNSIPSQLARENKKFIYKLIKQGARAREYEEAIQWLIQAGLLYKVANISTPYIPLKAYEDLSAYKLYVFETGLLMRLAGLDPQVFINSELFFNAFKGALAENYVAQSLTSTMSNDLYYWTSNGKAEIDFLVEYVDKIIPIEVKSVDDTKAKSLSVYKSKYNPRLRTRISTRNLKLTDDLLNIPLYYSPVANKIISNHLKRVGGEDKNS